jgi:hypothetical protein
MLMLNHLKLIDGSCTFPSTWDGNWYDSSLGDFVLSRSSHNIQGWSMTIHGQSVASWTCQTQSNSENLLLFKWVIFFHRWSNSRTWLKSRFQNFQNNVVRKMLSKRNIINDFKTWFEYYHGFNVSKLWIFFCYNRADQILEVNGVKKNVFRCIKWTNITDYSFHYYVYNGRILVNSQSG